LQLASRTIEIISNGSEFLVGDLQLNLNLQCVVMKNDEEGLIDNFVEKSGGKYDGSLF
jgi:hypothetical protein